MADKRSWQEICADASKEADPARLTALISDLLKALDANDTKTTTGNVCRPTQLA